MSFGKDNLYIGLRFFDTLKLKVSVRRRQVTIIYTPTCNKSIGFV